jgi:hypothetical protein
MGKLPFAFMNYNALALSPHELPTSYFALMNYHFVPKNPFHQSKPLTQTVNPSLCITLPP